MATWRTWVRGTVLATMLGGVAVGSASTQQHGAPTPSLGQNPFPSTAQTQSGRPDTEDDASQTQAAKQAKLRNDERQKRLVADTNRLLELATQLHEDVGKTDKNVLSLDVIRRSDEIEKLAHNIKDRMKG